MLPEGEDLNEWVAVNCMYHSYSPVIATSWLKDGQSQFFVAFRMFYNALLYPLEQGLNQDGFTMWKHRWKLWGVFHGHTQFSQEARNSNFYKILK